MILLHGLEFYSVAPVAPAPSSAPFFPQPRRTTHSPTLGCLMRQSPTPPRERRPAAPIPPPRPVTNSASSARLGRFRPAARWCCLFGNASPATMTYMPAESNNSISPILLKQVSLARWQRHNSKSPHKSSHSLTRSKLGHFTYSKVIHSGVQNCLPLPCLQHVNLLSDNQ